MRPLLLLAALLSAAAVRADELLTPEQTRQLLDLEKAKNALKSDPCLAENQFLNYYEVLFEAAPRHSVTEKDGAPPASAILTMDRCDVLTEDHVERKPMTPTAERWYTEGDWGLILTTVLGSDKTHVTVVNRSNGTWRNSAQMGDFTTTELFDISDKGRADANLTVYRWRAIKLPYSLHVSIRPSWSR